MESEVVVSFNDDTMMEDMGKSLEGLDSDISLMAVDFNGSSYPPEENISWESPLNHEEITTIKARLEGTFLGCIQYA